MLIAATRYRDCDAALRFLTRVLGLTAHAVFRDAQGAIEHAQLTLGPAMVMIGPEAPGEFDQWLTSPDQTGGRETTTIYAVVPDIHPVWERACQAGATILIALRSEAHGGESFSLRDPEGHIWTIGTYDPFAGRDA